MRATEEQATRSLLAVLRWHPVDADLAIAATTVLLRARLLTGNVRHFPMFPGLERPC